MRKEFPGLVIAFALATIYLLIPYVTFSQSITLNWNANPEPDIRYYTIYKSTSGSAMTKLAEVSVTQTNYTDSEISVGETYRYSITAVDSAGNTSQYSEEIEIPAIPNITGTDNEQMPQEFLLSQNYPNPFNPETEFNYTVPEASHISLTIYDVLGRTVRTLYKGDQQPGTFKIKWDGTDESAQKVASGVYIARFVAGSFVQVRKLVLQK